MRNIHVILTVIVIVKINGHVTDRLKSAELGETTQHPSENGLTKQISEKNYTKVVSDDDSPVYLDDVLFTLKSQEWSANEKPCLDHIYRLLYGLQNFTLWAVWDWDALPSEPQGLLFGNIYQLGNFDQCMETPWTDTYPELKTKYCLADVVLERTDRAVRRRVEGSVQPYQSALDFIEHRPLHHRPLNELTWGACVPAACPPRTIERLLGVMLARSHLGATGMRTNITINEECQISNQQRDYDALFYAFFIVIGTLVLICLVCTILNSTKETNSKLNKNKIIKAFCIRENAADLLTMKKEGIEIYYGIRYLTMCLIVLDHQIGIRNAGPISNGYTTDQTTQSVVGLLVLHNDLFVDTFFFLSGFLTVTTLTKYKRLPNPLVLILKRYVRLVVALAIMVFYTSAVYQYSGSGPLWNRAVAADTAQCRKNWWLNLLMVSNYIDTENICMVTSWYIPSDFHFFVVTVLAYALYKRWPSVGLVVAVVLTSGALILPGVVNYIYQLPAVQLFTFEFVVNPRGREDYHLAYIKSHTRYAAYLVGFYSGYIYVKYSADENLKKMKQKWSILGTCTALILMLLVMLLGSTFVWKTYTPVENAVYAALNRPIWAAGMALLAFCCAFGDVPIVKSFLSWYPWVPLSRLSYGLYLTHALLISRNIFSSRNPLHNDYFQIMNATAGVIFWGSLAALLLWLFVEAPANKLLMLCLRPKNTNTSTNTEQINPGFLSSVSTDEESHRVTVTASTSTNSVPTDTNGYLHKNLPSTISYSSKI